MQDQEIPPPVVEGDINGGVDVVRRSEAPVARWAATARSSKESSPLPWITATAPIWAATMATAAEGRGGQVFPRPIQSLIPSRFPLQERMPLRAYSLLSKTCSS